MRSRGSSGAAPFGTIVALIAMWFCISVPLVFLGAFFGFKQRLSEPPVSPVKSSQVKSCSRGSNEATIGVTASAHTPPLLLHVAGAHLV